jgi:hypothetical protein
MAWEEGEFVEFNFVVNIERQIHPQFVGDTLFAGLLPGAWRIAA